MAAGMVVVASRIGGAKEIIRDGENGLLFSPGDADELALAIARLAADRAMQTRIAEAGRQTILQEFNSKGMIDEIEGLLEGVVTRRQVAEIR
jgi:glycosyltransferase involved in cell wall biosynthesis